MNTTQLRIISAGLFFLFIFLFGFWLSKSGKPYHFAIFNLHKLIALGAVVYLAMTVYKVHQAAPLSPAQITVVAVTALCFVATILTGGLVSIEKTMPEFVHKLHQITPYLTMLATAVSLYLLLIVNRVLVNP